MDSKVESGLDYLWERVGSNTNVPLKNLVRQGWRAMYEELFGSYFVDSLAPHHAEAIEWQWESRLAFLEGRRPDYLAYFPIWSRGHQKTTIAEHMVVVDAMLSIAYGQPGFCLFIGREKEKVRENIANIEVLLSSEKVREYAPALSQVKKNDETNQQRQWTATFLHTAAGYVVKGGSTESTQAGARVEKTRPTYIVLDDIDGREDSPQISEKRFKRLTGEILPMRQGNTLVFFAQNLISRFSVMYRIQSQQVQVLTNRKPTEPIPAVRNLVTEQRTDPTSGLIRDFFISGESTWHAWDAQRIQDEIDSEGLPAFRRECQHEVMEATEGQVHHNYNDDVHPISFSQFASVFGSRDAWKDWWKCVANDWARTKSQYHANVAAYIAVSNANTPLPGVTFVIPFSFPAKTEPADVADRLLSALTPTNGNGKTWRQLINEAWQRTNAHQHFESNRERVEFETNYYKKIIPKHAKQALAHYHVRAAVMSHSEDTVRALFNDGFGFAFEPANPMKLEGIEAINEAMRVDYTKKHPFKDIEGYTRFFVLCPDDTSVEPQIVDGVPIYPPVKFPEALRPDDLHDADLFRWQMTHRRLRPPSLTDAGEKIDELRKTDDDFGQLLQFVYYKKLLANIRLSREEVIESEVEAIIPKAKIEALLDNDKGAAAMAITRKAHLEQELRQKLAAQVPVPTWSKIG